MEFLDAPTGPLYLCAGCHKVLSAERICIPCYNRFILHLRLRVKTNDLGDWDNIGHRTMMCHGELTEMRRACGAWVTYSTSVDLILRHAAARDPFWRQEHTDQEVDRHEQ